MHVALIFWHVNIERLVNLFYRSGKMAENYKFLQNVVY